MTDRSIADRQTDIYTWMREPDWTEEASLDWLKDWINRRPVAELGMISMLLPKGSGDPAPCTREPATERRGWPKKGDKMRFLGRNGHDYQLEAAKKVFNIEAVYEVERFDLGDWKSYIRFVGIDGEFNHVMFDWADAAPPVRSAASTETLGAALDVIMNASCDEQLTAATSIAGNIGMVLVNEPPHPDSPHATPPSPDAPWTYTDELIERALTAYEAVLLDLHANAATAGEPISVSEIRGAALKAAFAAAFPRNDRDTEAR